MKINKFNLIPILGIIPLFIVMNLLILALVWNNKILFYCLLLIFVFLNYKIFFKFVYMPKGKGYYQNLTKIDWENQCKIDIPLFSSSDFDKYDFITRTVEVFSPLIVKKEDDIKVVISEKLLNNEKKIFNDIAITREVIKYKTMSHIKILLRLIIPLLIVINFILLIIFKKINLYNYFSSFIINFIAPFILLMLFILNLVSWNIYLSKEEQKIDTMLLEFFSVEEIISYIKRLEEIEGRDEKEKYKSFSEHYLNQRIKNLKNNNV